MNKDKRIRELYNATFQEIHASDELKGMVEDMANQKKIIWRNVWKKSIAAAAAIAVVFAAGNVVTYAATGDNLVKYVTVKIQGENTNLEQDIKLEKTVDENGRPCYRGTFGTDTEYGELEVVTDDFDVNGTISSEGVEYTEDSKSQVNIEIKEKTNQK